MMECKKDSLCAAFEAILFASGDPVSSKRVSQIIGITENELQAISYEVIKKFEQSNSGIRIIKLSDKYQMCSKEEYSEYIKKFMNAKKEVPLSSAATEVLAIIAYKQPITRAFIESVRGTDCREILNSLVSKMLIEEKGRLNVPGTPIIYGTTDKFLRCMGMSSIDKLPSISNKLSDKL